MKIFGLYPSASELDRIDALATAAVNSGADANKETWLDAVRKVQPKFDWSKYPVVTARFGTWLDRECQLALQREIGEGEALWEHGKYTALARHSANVYIQSPDVLRLVLSSERNVGLIEDFEIFSDERWQLRGVGYTLRGEAYLIFRGTLVRSLRNWRLNFRSGEVEPGVHRGFLIAWHQLEGQVRPWLARLSPKPPQITLSGHSLGGAMAVLAAYELSADYKIRNVITFGSPRLATEAFEETYREAGLTAVTRRYIHETDIVPRFVPSWLYSHLGEDYFITKGGAIVEDTPDPPFLQRAYEGFRKTGGVEWGYGSIWQLIKGIYLESKPTPASTIETFVKTLATSLPQYTIIAIGGLSALWSVVCVFGLACFGAFTVKGDIAQHAMVGYAKALDSVAKKSIGKLDFKGFGIGGSAAS